MRSGEIRFCISSSAMPHASPGTNRLRKKFMGREFCIKGAALRSPRHQRILSPLRYPLESRCKDCKIKGLSQAAEKLQEE
jgi:hypothetical protein